MARPSPGRVSDLSIKPRPKRRNVANSCPSDLGGAYRETVAALMDGAGLSASAVADQFEPAKASMTQDIHVGEAGRGRHTPAEILAPEGAYAAPAA